jgi:hypothetical protein
MLLVLPLQPPPDLFDHDSASLLRRYSDHAKRHCYDILSRTTSKGNAYLRCHRGSTRKISTTKLPGNGRAAGNVKRPSRLTDCPFSLRLLREETGGYRGKVLVPIHNHPPELDGLPSAFRAVNSRWQVPSYITRTLLQHPTLKSMSVAGVPSLFTHRLDFKLSPDGNALGKLAEKSEVPETTSSPGDCPATSSETNAHTTNDSSNSVSTISIERENDPLNPSFTRGRTPASPEFSMPEYISALDEPEPVPFDAELLASLAESKRQAGINAALRASELQACMANICPECEEDMGEKEADRWRREAGQDNYHHGILFTRRRKMCSEHTLAIRRRKWIAAGLPTGDDGKPSICWEKLPARCSRILQRLYDDIMQERRQLCSVERLKKSLLEAIQQRHSFRTLSRRLRFMPPSYGYYGSEAYETMFPVLRASPLFKTFSLSDIPQFSQGMYGGLTELADITKSHILVPELLVLLIAEDLGINEQMANSVLVITENLASVISSDC